MGFFDPLVAFAGDDDGGSGAGGGSSQGGGADEPQGGAPEGQGAAERTQGDRPDPDTSAKLDQVIADNAKYRRDNKALSDRLKEYEDREKSETQKATETNQRLTDENRQEREKRVRAEVRADAYQIGRKLGIVDTDDAVRLLPEETPRDDDGRPSDLEGALKKLVEAKPWLLDKERPATSGGGKTQPEGGAGGVDEAGITPGYARLRAAFAAGETDKK